MKTEQVQRGNYQYAIGQNNIMFYQSIKEKQKTISLAYSAYETFSKFFYFICNVAYIIIIINYIY